MPRVLGGLARYCATFILESRITRILSGVYAQHDYIPRLQFYYRRNLRNILESSITRILSGVYAQHDCIPLLQFKYRRDSRNILELRIMNLSWVV